MKTRIEQIMKAKDLTSTAFAKRIDINPSGLSHILNGRNQPSLEIVRKLLNCYPELNPDWLISGKGEMLRSEISSVVPSPGLSLFSDSNLVESKTATEKPMPAPVQPTQVQAETVKTTPEQPVETIPQRRISRIIAFFSDGSIEEYTVK